MSSAGFSSVRRARVRDVLARHVDAGDGPGAVAVVARHGQVHVETVGNLAFERTGVNAPMAADTICRVASMTKPIVAACTMTLVEDGTLRLDDPVDELLPEMASMRVLADPNGPLENTVAASARSPFGICSPSPWAPAWPSESASARWGASREPCRSPTR